MAMEVDQAPRLTVPGFGQPVDKLTSWSRSKEKQNRLPHAIADWFGSSGITLRERRMLEFINQITDKPDWTQKILDEGIVAKWKAEGVRWDDSLPEAGDWWLSETMFDVCMQELREKAKVYEKTGIVAVLDAECTIVKSDRNVSDELCEQLRNAVRPLEDVSDRLKDWHPGSGEMVLDLVHPSLFPVVYGLTKALPYNTVPLQKCLHYTGKGVSTKPFGAKNYSRKISWGDESVIAYAWGSFQWLPSHIHFTETGIPKISSYINNLHPNRHTELYGVLEQYVDAAIPLWNETISWYQNRMRIPLDATSDEDYVLPEDIKYPREELKKQLEENFKPDLDGQNEEDLTDEEWAEAWGFYDEYHDWKRENRKLTFPEPTYAPQETLRERLGARKIDLRTDFAERGIQIIFKLANIHLTPDKPRYDGGSWHVEGSLNEHICATALFYYDCDNVTDSRLAFQQSYDVEEMVMKPAQSEYDSALAYYGIEQDGSPLLSLGSVVTRQNRLIAFPNILQHQVQPFELVDKTKPGHRKILAMFLVDPHVPILSTANVPPQRKDWWSEEVRKIKPFAALPNELFDMIIDKVDGFPISWEEAVKIREELMKERSAANENYGDAMFQDTFSFCEH